MKKYCLLILSLLLLLTKVQASLAAGSGACSSHGGVDCEAGADIDGSTVCNDGWKDSSVSFLNVCEKELSLMKRIESVATSYCINDFLRSNKGVSTSKNINPCIQEKTFSIYKTFDPSCERNMMLSNRGTCFCLGYLSSGICASNNYVNDVYGNSCSGEKLSTSTFLDVLNLSIEHGNTFFDLFIKVSCNKTINSLSIAKNGLTSTNKIDTVSDISRITDLRPSSMIDMQGFCVSSLGQDSTFNSVTGNCQCRNGFEKRDNTCKPAIPAFSGAPKTKSDLLRCSFVGNKTNKLYYAKGNRTISKMTLTGKTCFTKETDAQKAGYRKSK